jgi:carbon storage regulator
MLVLSRRAGQMIQIGPDVAITIIRIEGDRAVVGISAPRAVSVLRGELVDEVRDEVRAAADTSAAIQRLVKG